MKTTPTWRDKNKDMQTQTVKTCTYTHTKPHYAISPNNTHHGLENVPKKFLISLSVTVFD